MRKHINFDHRYNMKNLFEDFTNENLPKLEPAIFHDFLTVLLERVHYSLEIKTFQ